MSSDVQKEATRKLEKLLINEVSGVDSPANLSDGWMVLKSNVRGNLSNITKLSRRETTIMDVIDELAKKPELLSKVRDEVRRLTALPSGRGRWK